LSEPSEQKAGLKERDTTFVDTSKIPDTKKHRQAYKK
jgi:hypothetical protein